tara:strand:- start:25 stop:600 length:576 start_codon:yes stop_codon:yes gene_type:complete
MSGKLRVGISVELIDLYTKNVIHTDDSGEAITDYAVSMERINPLSGYIRDKMEKFVTSNPEVWGYTNGKPDYLEVPNSSAESNGIAIGPDNQGYVGMWIRHTGRYYDPTAADKQGDEVAINHSIDLRKELIQGGSGLDSVWTKICSINPGMSVFLDQVSALGTNLGWSVKSNLGAGNDPVCVDFFLVSNTN